MDLFGVDPGCGQGVLACCCFLLGFHFGCVGSHRCFTLEPEPLQCLTWHLQFQVVGSKESLLRAP